MKTTIKCVECCYKIYYYNVLDYDDFKKQEVNWDEKYLVPTKFELKKHVYIRYDNKTNNYISCFEINERELYQAKNDPRWLNM